MRWPGILHSLFFVGLAWFGSVTCPAPAAEPERRRDEAKAKEVFEQLAMDYRAYGLPLPPEGAKLMRFRSGWRTAGADEEDTYEYHLGFLLEAGDKKKPPRLLVGTKEFQPDDKDFEMRAVEPRLEAAKGFEPCNRHWPFQLNCGLAVAIQCKARGWDDLAQHLLDVSLKQECGHQSGAYFQRANLTPREALAHLAFAHWANEVIEPNADGAMIAKRLKALFEANPKLDTKDKRYLLKSLERSLIPSKAKPGSVDALIDELADFSGGKKKETGKAPHSSAYERLGNLFFEAVPSLIDHLEDKRLTHGHTTGFNNFAPWHRQVQHVVSDLLQEMAGDDLKKNWLDRQHGWAVAKADAQAWWEKAHKLGEEAYLVEHVLPADPKAWWPNERILKALAEKYPKHLPKIYTTILDDRPQIESHPVADALGKSRLPRGKKIEILEKAAKHEKMEHRHGAFWALKDLDKDRFIKMLVETLEKLPPTPADPYWKCKEAAFAILVRGTNEDRVWETLTKVAKRSDVGLRMEMMHKACGNPSTCKRQIAFLAGFLNDVDVRDEKSNPKMFEGLYAGFIYPQLEVRNLAAMELAGILELKNEPTPSWGAKEWEKLREQVLNETKK